MDGTLGPEQESMVGGRRQVSCPESEGQRAVRGKLCWYQARETTGGSSERVSVPRKTERGPVRGRQRPGLVAMQKTVGKSYMQKDKEEYGRVWLWICAWSTAADEVSGCRCNWSKGAVSRLRSEKIESYWELQRESDKNDKCMSLLYSNKHTV